VSVIALQIPISTLQKDGKSVSQAANILDGDFVIGVWASASRQRILSLIAPNQQLKYGVERAVGGWQQVSRLGMPLTNEAVIPVGRKDYWNALSPYKEDAANNEFFYNPELALYMDDDLFGGAVPAFAQLRIQKNSLGAFNFGNGADGLYALKGSAAVAGTALDDAIFGTLLLPGPGKPRSVDIWPAFHTGVPNFPPYQLATGKMGNPLAVGKPFVNNFLPNGGDMLRLNMAVPATPRDDENFSTLGLIQAAVLGLTDSDYNGSAALQWIPNMDGFPNGRRLEDDVTRIELQAVAGVVLAAIGLWYDDFDGTNPVTQDLVDVLTFTTGVEKNDAPFQTAFPYVAMPWSGAGECGGKIVDEAPEADFIGEGPDQSVMQRSSILGVATPKVIAQVSPNPVADEARIAFAMTEVSNVSVHVFNSQSQLIATLVDGRQEAGVHHATWNTSALPTGMYFVRVESDGKLMQTLKVVIDR
jgi:hypothetical protein